MIFFHSFAFSTSAQLFVRLCDLRYVNINLSNSYRTILSSCKSSNKTIFSHKFSTFKSAKTLLAKAVWSLTFFLSSYRLYHSVFGSHECPNPHGLLLCDKVKCFEFDVCRLERSSLFSFFFVIQNEIENFNKQFHYLFVCVTNLWPCHFIDI